MAGLNGEVPYDEEGNIIYPHIVKQKFGYKVNMSKGRSLPGIYTSYILAERAILKDVGSRENYKQQRKLKNASE